MERLVFSSPGSTRGLAEARRLSRWWDEYRAALGGIEVSADERMPLETSVEYLDLGTVGLGCSAGSINRFNRRGSKTVADGDDRFNLVINRGRAHTQADTRLGQAVIAPGSAVLFDFAEQSDHVCPGGHKVTVLFMPRRLLRQMVPNAVDIAGRVVPASNEALRLLAYCADGLLDDENLSHPAVLARAGQIFLDLAVLAFGTDRDNSEIARLRGLRAARLDAVLRVIRAEYADPEISPASVAARTGISIRYLHQLLHETGESFSERVKELRLEKALALLCRAGSTPRKIIDVAYEAGFNDLPHFNRLFRRRYELTPTAARTSR